ncbi:Uma2 family endonuclease [Azospirillum sp.]|uniref:Uma2 family endonuclease n=1 Tax=Azospirillum sp. TaxID=34012 RepID=UPI003D762011
MSEFAYKRMTVDEFLVWDDGTDTRYELIDGVPVAMAPTYGGHQIIAANFGRHLANTLDARPPCHVRSEAGILKPNSIRTYFQGDLAVTCSPHEAGQYAIPNPVVIVEILSPSTEADDRKVKLPVYRSIPSVQEIVLVHSERLYAEVHRRLDDTRWQVDLLTEPEDVLRLDSVGYAQPLALLYANVDLGKSPTTVASGESSL